MPSRSNLLTRMSNALTSRRLTRFPARPAGDGNGRIVVFHADPFEINDSRLNAGQLARIGQNPSSPNIDPGGITTPFNLNGDEDWYEFRPTTTNTFQVKILFDRVPTLANGRPGLAGDGDLSLDIYDAAGTLIVSGVADLSGNNRTAIFGATNNPAFPLFNRIFIRVKGAGNQPTPSINIYDFDNLAGIGTGTPGVGTLDTVGPVVMGATFPANPMIAPDAPSIGNDAPCGNISRYMTLEPTISRG